jgi:hypothetical protein
VNCEEGQVATARTIAFWTGLALPDQQGIKDSGVVVVVHLVSSHTPKPAGVAEASH